MNESKHTPLPWRILDNHPKRSCLYIQAEQSGLIRDEVATLYGPDCTDGITEANAALIVRAVNNHADLVAALEAWIAAYGWAEVTGTMRDLRGMSKAALAKAKG